jgi:hypothetical protein
VDTARLAVELEREPVDPEQDIGQNGRIRRRVIRQNVQKMKLSAQRAVAPAGSSTRNFENYVCLLHARATAAYSEAPDSSKVL